MPGFFAKLNQIITFSGLEYQGMPELPRAEGKPEVFVLAGNGSGAATYRSLQRQRIPFATGILWENDLDYPAAKALASEVVGVKPFARMDECAVERARELIAQCGRVICTVDTENAGEYYKEALALLG